MENTLNTAFPRQQLNDSQKGPKWRKQCVDFADSRTFYNYSPVRHSVKKKKINYDLMAGKLHMDDVHEFLNPYGIKSEFLNVKLQHYPIINSKIEVLKGEEESRLFDYRVIVTNPTAISEKENAKKEAIHQRLQEWIMNTSQSEEDAQAELDKIGDFFSYEWQDIREVRANHYLHHYVKELNVKHILDLGFNDALTVGEEIYQCDIVGGEPTLTRLNPLKVRVLRSGSSNKVEDADMIITEDYWSPGKIIDTFFEDLNEKDRKYIEGIPYGDRNGSTEYGNTYDERDAFIRADRVADEATINGFYYDLFSTGMDTNADRPFDEAGNIRVLRVYWKSRRKVKRIKTYDYETGEENYDFMPGNYIIDPDAGEEEQIYWINQAWEGTKIGKDLYINMRPRLVQYNRVSNPSRCHFGIIGTIYNQNDDKPFSMVERMKPYSYLYDVFHDRLNKAIARSWGSLIKMDFAKVPEGWSVDKWLYYAKTMGIMAENSFKEGDAGAALGKLAGGLNNASSGVVQASDLNIIQQYTNLLAFVEQEMAKVAGISPQREGQISNRETVGGVERSTLQSSHITEWIFSQHEDTKRRVLECLLETIKMAAKGKSIKFQYLVSDGSTMVEEIDGDEYAECDYGLVVDNSQGSQQLNQKLDMLAQAALQNQLLDFSTIMRLYTSTSLAEKQRMVERAEQKTKEMQQQQQQQQMQLQQQQMEQQAQTAQMQMELQKQMHDEDNETKILVAQINSQAEADRLALMNRDSENEGVVTEKDQFEMNQRIKEFEASLKQKENELKFKRDKQAEDARLKKLQINKQTKTSK